MKTLSFFFYGALLLCMGGALALFASCSDEDEEAVVPAETPAAYVYDVKELCGYNGDKRIYGQLYTSRGAVGKRPAVILSHSFGLTHASLTSYAKALADKGYAAYCFDFCGGSEESQSDGEVTEMTVFSEVEDLKQVLAFVRQAEEVEADRLFLLGTSQGGLVSALVAEECGEQVSGLILFYPAFNIAELAQRFFGDKETIPEETSFLGFTMGADYIRSLLDYDVYQHIGTFNKEVLIVHGSSDFIVPVSASQQAVACYPHAALHVIEGATHGFNADNLGALGDLGNWLGDYDNQVLPLVFDYLERNAPLQP